MLIVPLRHLADMSPTAFFPTRREIEELRRKHHRQQNDDYKHRV